MLRLTQQLSYSKMVPLCLSQKAEHQLNRSCALHIVLLHHLAIKRHTTCVLLDQVESSGSEIKQLERHPWRAFPSFQ